MHILIADDDRILSESLQQIFTDAQYEISCVSDGRDALQLALRQPFSLILLHAALPTKDGLSVVRELRRLRVQTPIIMLSKQDSVSERILGLDAGADDYMICPFHKDELLARVRALIRRTSPNTKPDLQFGDLSFHPERAVMSCGEPEIRLNFKEAAILKLLLSTPHSIISKEELIHKVWGYASTTSGNNVEAYISFLRKKLQAIGSRVCIISIKKQGYKLEYTT